jgi:hypothetical protein
MVHKITKYVGLSTNDFKQLLIKIRFLLLQDFPCFVEMEEADC